MIFLSRDNIMTRSVVGYHQPLVQSCKATTLSETFLMTCKHKIKALIGYICILHVIQIKKKKLKLKLVR